MKKLMSLFTCLSLLVSTQVKSQGIKFEEGLSWQQIKEKAKKENKYIFVDCYTTWCSPCKAMEKDVYPDKSVGDFFNDKFISAKFQMNRTDEDDNAIKSRYLDVAIIAGEYKVSKYPTYLFFSPDGKPVHNAVGAQSVANFIATAKTALTPGRVYDDPFKEYKKLLKEYKAGGKRHEKMPYMISKAKEAGEWDEVQILVTDYYTWLLTQPKEKNIY